MIPEHIKSKWKLDESNYDSHYLRFNDRQAGISLVFDNEKELYYYNAYCIEISLLKELFSAEYTFLEEALETLDAEFGTWELVAYDKKKSGCGSCAAKN